METKKRKFETIFVRLLLVVMGFLILCLSIDSIILNQKIKTLNEEIDAQKIVIDKGKEEKFLLEKRIKCLEGEIFVFQKRFPHFSKIVEAVETASKKHGLDFLLLMSLISIESNFVQYASSNKDAHGLMQVHFPTWKNEFKIDKSEKLFDIEFNIDCGCRILKKYLNDSKGDVFRALFLYGGYGYNNEGPYADKVLNNKFFKK